MVRRSAPLPEQPNDCRTHRSIGGIDRSIGRTDRSIGGTDRSIGGSIDRLADRSID